MAVRTRRRNALRMRRIASMGLSGCPHGLMLARASAIEQEATELYDDLVRHIKDGAAMNFVKEALPNEPVTA